MHACTQAPAWANPPRDPPTHPPARRPPARPRPAAHPPTHPPHPWAHPSQVAQHTTLKGTAQRAWIHTDLSTKITCVITLYKRKKRGKRRDQLKDNVSNYSHFTGQGHKLIRAFLWRVESQDQSTYNHLGNKAAESLFWTGIRCPGSNHQPLAGAQTEQNSSTLA